MDEQPTELQRLNELVARIQRAITTGEEAQDRIQKIVQMLLASASKDVAMAAGEALRIYRAEIAENRNVEWARVMSAIWVDDPATLVPRNPQDLQVAILGWQQARERDITKTAHQKGYLAGWAAAVEEFTSFGWGGRDAGKGLEETLVVARKRRPTL